MLPEKLKKLILLLTDKTDKKMAIWNRTNAEGQFKLSISDGSAITISSWSPNNYEAYYLTIFNKNGDVIEAFDTETDNATTEDYSVIQSFYKSVRNSYYKVEETIDELFNTLSSDKVIGKEEKFTPPLPPSQSDDLPF